MALFPSGLSHRKAMRYNETGSNGSLSPSHLRSSQERDALWITRCTHLKQELRAGGGKGEKAQLIQHNQLVLADLRQKARELVLLLRFDEIIDQSCHVVKAHAVALPTGSQKIGR